HEHSSRPRNVPEPLALRGTSAKEFPILLKRVARAEPERINARDYFALLGRSSSSSLGFSRCYWSSTTETRYPLASRHGERKSLEAASNGIADSQRAKREQGAGAVAVGLLVLAAEGFLEPGE